MGDPARFTPPHLSPQNPALAGQNIYQSREVQDKQIVRLIGKIPTLAALAYHRASGRKPAQPNQNLGYAEASRCALWVAAPLAGGAQHCDNASAGPATLSPAWLSKRRTTRGRLGALAVPAKAPSLGPTCAALVAPPHHHPLQNFLYMLDAGSHPGYRPNPRLARALDILFILHAEHELNCR